MRLPPVRLHPGDDLRAALAPGCIVRTTAEVLVARLPERRLAREAEASTGFQELVIRPNDLGGG